MNKKEYFLEMLSDSFEECGLIELWKSISEENRHKIGDDIAMAEENIGQAFYTPPASDMVNSRIKELELALRRSQSDADEWRLAFKKNVAMRRKCEVEDISVEKSGHAQIN